MHIWGINVFIVSLFLFILQKEHINIFFIWAHNHYYIIDYFIYNNTTTTSLFVFNEWGLTN